VATIYGLLKLIDLPKEAQKAVENGQLAMTTAQLIARLPSKESRKEMLDWMTNGIGFDDPPSFRDVKWEIEHRYMVELKAAPFSTKDAALAPAAGSCEACPKQTSAPIPNATGTRSSSTPRASRP
jgi:hypothetical protein